ncbi:hypothetical protein BC829DRAFT_389444 [Chytridium lagenaria]|nr:hypothetical protein BC829DRAFT_389444 [Chytridium lagenaria]
MAWTAQLLSSVPPHVLSPLCSSALRDALHDERPQTSRGRQGSHHRHESSGGGSKASSTTGVDGINVKSSSPSVGNGPHSLYGATAFGQGYLHPHHYPDPSANYGMIGLTSASHEMAGNWFRKAITVSPAEDQGLKGCPFAVSARLDPEDVRETKAT